MKDLTVELFLGVVIAVPIIYALRPLDGLEGRSAIAFIVFLSVGIVITVRRVYRAVRKKENS